MITSLLYRRNKFQYHIQRYNQNFENCAYSLHKHKHLYATKIAIEVYRSYLCKEVKTFMLRIPCYDFNFMK